MSRSNHRHCVTFIIGRSFRHGPSTRGRPDGGGPDRAAAKNLPALLPQTRGRRGRTSGRGGGRHCRIGRHFQPGFVSTMSAIAKILLLGSGELGREFTISAKRLGAHVVACDSYAGAPAMQMADEAEVFSMLDGAALSAVIEKHRPDYIVPEVEAIRTDVLKEFEDRGFNVMPSARGTMPTLNRHRIRDVAANELGLPTSKFLYAESLEEMR